MKTLHGFTYINENGNKWVSNQSGQSQELRKLLNLNISCNKNTERVKKGSKHFNLIQEGDKLIQDFLYQFSFDASLRLFTDNIFLTFDDKNMIGVYKTNMNIIHIDGIPNDIDPILLQKVYIHEKIHNLSMKLFNQKKQGYIGVGKIDITKDFEFINEGITDYISLILIVRNYGVESRGKIRNALYQENIIFIHHLIGWISEKTNQNYIDIFKEMLDGYFDNHRILIQKTINLLGKENVTLLKNLSDLNIDRLYKQLGIDNQKLEEFKTSKLYINGEAKNLFKNNRKANNDKSLIFK